MRPSIIRGMPSAPICGADARRHRHVGLELSVADPQRQQQILGRQPLGLDLDHADAALAARHGRAQQPGPLAGFRAHGQRDAAAARPRQAEIDVVEFPVLAVALIVDSVRLPFLRPSSLRSRPSRPVAPRLSIHASSAAKSGIMPRLLAGAAARGRAPAELGASPARNAGSRRRRGHERLPVGAGEHRDLAVRLDPHLHLGADQAQPLGAHAAGHQAGAGEADFRLGRARDDLAVGVAHDDVADAQRGAAAGVALELRAADGDAVVAAEILFDRGGEPRRREIEIDRSAAEPPPQRHASRPAPRRRATAAAMPMRRQRVQKRSADRRQQVETELLPVSGRHAAQRSRARGRFPLEHVELDAGLKLAQGRDVRIRVLIRHAPTGRPLDRRISAALPAAASGLLPLIANSCENRSTCQHSPAYRLTLH